RGGARRCRGRGGGAGGRGGVRPPTGRGPASVPRQGGRPTPSRLAAARRSSGLYTRSALGTERSFLLEEPAALHPRLQPLRPCRHALFPLRPLGIDPEPDPVDPLLEDVQLGRHLVLLERLVEEDAVLGS